MSQQTKDFVTDLLAKFNNDVEATARFMRDSLHLNGGLKTMRALIAEAQAA